ncbi:MAG: hypothetical protein JST16_16815 [Bdellovibrionales bacterium]|nr:hypothetical protein [Bdellovibrionales bacterium]
MSGASKTRESLVAGYTSGYRRVEICAFFGMLFLLVVNAFRVRLMPSDQPLGALVLAVAAALLADLFSGLVHWTFDTWGSTDLPVLGNTVLRGFREHHVDPLSITRHGLIQVTGGTNILGCLLLLAAFATSSVPLVWFLGCLSICVAYTNISHKWAHQKKNVLPVRVLQKFRLALPASMHDLHHRAPYVSHYCITFGWMNGVLDGINFWRVSEQILILATGAMPRSDEQAYF